jgi:hemerythrin-like metal-binding protein
MWGKPEGRTVVDKIVFSEDLKLGVDSIDKQHGKLVDLINTLIEMEARPSDANSEAQALEDLADYIDKHFQYEEAIMKEVGYPDFDAHRAMHVAFVRKVMEFNKQHRQGDANLGVDILLFLSKWLIDHIKGEDPRYVEKFRAAGY